MDFPSCVNGCGASDSGLKWWDQLNSEADSNGNSCPQHYVRQNITRTNLFTLNPQHTDHVSAFCSALDDLNDGDALARAINAIRQSGRMICAGPGAGDVGAAASALVTLTSFVKRYADPGKRGPMGDPSDPDIHADIWNALDDPRYYDFVVNPNEEYKSSLPNRFWARLDDIDNFESTGRATAVRLRQFLGLDHEARLSLLISIRKENEPHFTVPTGWDGFSNGYFRENAAYAMADIDSHFGVTLDLAATPEKVGAREVVSPPVPTPHTYLVRKYS